ncbi:hypothetical protein SeMB42_g04718 [Synchytrium endobioticum]|uniref:Uncharacterized protein n=1 Tax=Synchytrium endobioticum TaxID=286115 RepID=A0A507CWC2_9FUNG|nr:hypothetical protein SeMB42_g04718 [Synchytrium endobioticum]
MYLVPSRQPYIVKYGGARVKAVSQTATQYSLTAEIGGLENCAYSHALVVWRCRPRRSRRTASVIPGTPLDADPVYGLDNLQSILQYLPIDNPGTSHGNVSFVQGAASSFYRLAPQVASAGFFPWRISHFRRVSAYDTIVAIIQSTSRSNLGIKVHQNASEPTATLLHFPPLTRSDIHQCRFSQWYPLFSSMTMRSKIIPLSTDFVEYLHADGVYLPLDQNGRPQPAAIYDDNEDLDEHESVDGESDEEVDLPSFPHLQATITSSISDLGGAVFPKLNWSAPTDASWIATTGTLKCCNFSDVFLLLKSSDFIVHDLDHAFDGCIDASSGAAGDETSVKMEVYGSYEVVLRKWGDYAQSMEFRCFVFEKRLIAISQRDTTTYYDFLIPMKDELLSSISQFITNLIIPKFPLDNYVTDVYIYKSSKRPSIIDFNPFRESTDALLFSWSEILELAYNPNLHSTSTSSDPRGIHFRLIESQQHTYQHGGAGYKHMTNRVPKDIIDLSEGRTIDEFIEDFEELIVESNR